MKRVMCLDYGDKNIGVAVSDSLRITAQALTVIRRDNESAIKAVLQKLTELITKYDIGEIVLGYPRNMNGSEGFRCEKTREFKIRLEKRFVTPVILWDERLSTAGADRSLMHLTKEKRKNIIDKMAAVFILQGYLDNQNALNKGNTAANKILTVAVIRKKKEKSMMADYENNENMNEFDEAFEDFYESVMLVDEDGSESEYLIIDSLEDGGTSYFLLIAEEDEENETADAIILKEMMEDGEMVMRELENSEFDRISALFESGNDDYELEV